MKKILCLLIIFMLPLTLTSCGVNSNVGNTEKPTESEYIIVESDPVSVTFYDYDQYLDFIDTAPLPENFVTYESMKQFGSFYTFTVDDPKVCDFYSYYFIDENGIGLLLMMNHFEELNSAITGVSTSDTELLLDDKSLLCINEVNSLGYTSFVLSNSVYVYQDGKLMEICWENDRTLYTLLISDGNKAIICDSIITKLLYLDTAEEAIAEIKSWTKTADTQVSPQE